METPSTSSNSLDDIFKSVLQTTSSGPNSESHQLDDDQRFNGGVQEERYLGLEMYNAVLEAYVLDDGKYIGMNRRLEPSSDSTLFYSQRGNPCFMVDDSLYAPRRRRQNGHVIAECLKNGCHSLLSIAPDSKFQKNCDCAHFVNAEKIKANKQIRRAKIERLNNTSTKICVDKLVGTMSGQLLKRKSLIRAVQRSVARSGSKKNPPKMDCTDPDDRIALDMDLNMGLTQEQAAAPNDNFTEMIKPDMTELIKEDTSSSLFRAPVVLPTHKLSQNGIQSHAEINTQVANALIPLTCHADPDVRKIAEAVVSMMRERNIQLAMADSYPDGFRNGDRLEAISAVPATLNSTPLLMISQMFGQETHIKREQSPSPRHQALRQWMSSSQSDLVSFRDDLELEDIKPNIASNRM